jgi:hypothetical protein
MSIGQSSDSPDYASSVGPTQREGQAGCVDQFRYPGPCERNKWVVSPKAREIMESAMSFEWIQESASGLQITALFQFSHSYNTHSNERICAWHVE